MDELFRTTAEPSGVLDSPRSSAATPIPFNRPSITDAEQIAIAEALARAHLSGDGPFTKQCHQLLEQQMGVPRALLTTSCTHALEMAALLLDVGHGDEVIIPSFTFVSSANAFVLRGARPVFIDIRPDTLNLDERLLEELISPRTKAVVPVHYAGVGCEMDTICDITRRHGLAIVEDNAHGLFARYKSRLLGTFGCLATQSFHETKNFSCGEGGALLINDPQFVERAEILREKGTDRSRFFRGMVDKYTWVDIGSSYLPSEILAAALYAQLERRAEIQVKRERVWRNYFQWLGPWAARCDTRLPVVPAHCEQAYHLFYMLLPTPAERDALIQHLKSRSIQSVFHYLPLNRSKGSQLSGAADTDCPVAEDISERLLRLPFYTDLGESDQQAVVEAIEDFNGSA
ncbi:MAG: dTDP-4-amino-4,6-dideoxygalactose transaminase [Gemmatimonadaceae bacterium]